MKLKLAVLMLLTSCKPVMAFYTEAQAGYLNYGVRVGKEWKSLDFSGGYSNVMNNDSTLSSDVQIHSLDFSIGKSFALNSKVKAGFSGGIGYSIPNLDSGHERADNSHSWLLGGHLSYDLTKNWTIGGYVKSLFFATDSLRTTYSSHTETLSNGQDVEVEDVSYREDSTKLNSVVGGLSIRYRF